MPEELDRGSAIHLAATTAWLAGAIAGAWVLGWALYWLLQRVSRRSALVNDFAALTRMPVRVILMVIAARIAVGATVLASAPGRGWVDQLFRILMIAAMTWLVAAFTLLAERRAIARFAGGELEVSDADRLQRRVKTQITTLRRLAIAVVVVLGTAAALMTFPSFTQIGTTMFASAGILSVVAGLAAQTSLGSVFAGMQISFSDAVRVGDVVVLEGEWGRIEEITLTYVVVQIWDQRRLILPTTYFTKTPFENWTRRTTDLLGTVQLDVDFTAPVEPMRAELDRLLSASDMWDGRSSGLVVTDAVDGYLRVRITVSAADSGALFNLRCAVREGMVEWLQRTHPTALPRWRVEQPSASAAAGDSGLDSDTNTPAYAH
ncbi:mechanosensitive ion channel [Mycolicibacter terrae]|uniref:Mechanosensitive ion channel protein MscS n=2 Tax=Mycolicibacter TaxID=1073531 RepID=A0A1A2NWH1_MYCSD|nr:MULTISPECIES: mechanosensitive ion channel domain-containing protein [Mycolicibacter]OBH19406.1 mechanosensitive ion channel protein MscS [Mycolicibacter sinensis]OBI33502.1 mechanosensitive ion channel protein MscS [Mycolicibacter sinensis]RRR45226.1 mechanosensitive ion channel [Mycolicibacter terrae]